MYYVAIDIGCIECDENTAVLGIFTDKDAAERVTEEHRARQEASWRGQHSFEVFEVPDLDTEVRQDY